MVEVIKTNNVYIAKGQYNSNVRLVIYRLLMNCGPTDVYIDYYDKAECVDKVVRITCQCLADWKKHEEKLYHIFEGNLSHLEHDPNYNIYNHGEVTEES